MDRLAGVDGDCLPRQPDAPSADVRNCGVGLLDPTPPGD